MEDPRWSMPYWCDGIAAFKGAEQLACDSFLLGRVTYETFAAVWPNRTKADDEGAELMNSLPKYVATRTLKALTWNNSHLLEDDAIAAIQKLKTLPGKDLLVYGSGLLVDSLIKAHLVDQFNLLIYPIVLGHGKRLFNVVEPVKLKLEEAKSYPTGAVSQIYRTLI
jgi:dihydrofolate reductase